MSLAYAVCANDWSKEERTVETSDGKLKKMRKEQKNESRRMWKRGRSMRAELL